MDLNDYQTKAQITAIYPGRGRFSGLTYCALKLNGEAGEVAELVGKAIRDDCGLLTADRKNKLVRELGDVLWYIGMLATELNLDLNSIAAANLMKLADRKEAGTLQGSGSDR